MTLYALALSLLKKIQFATSLANRLPTMAPFAAASTQTAVPVPLQEPTFRTTAGVRAGAVHPRMCTPLRIVRVVEQGQTRGHVGRMVISGRIADVCAELDRLAACEAA